MAEQRSPKPSVAGSNPARPAKLKDKMEFIIKNLSKIILGIIIASLLFFTIKYRLLIKKFILEVKSELTKVSWSNRKELVGATWVVISITGILGIFIGVIDLILSRFLGLVVR